MKWSLRYASSTDDESQIANPPELGTPVDYVPKTKKLHADRRWLVLGGPFDLVPGLAARERSNNRTFNSGFQMFPAHPDSGGVSFDKTFPAFKSLYDALRRDHKDNPRALKYFSSIIDDPRDIHDYEKDSAFMLDQAKQAHEKPDQLVRVYRSVPKNVNVVEPGDFVATHPGRALQINDRNTFGGKPDSHHIIHTLIPAKYLHSAVPGGIQSKKFDPMHITRWSDFGYFP